MKTRIAHNNLRKFEERTEELLLVLEGDTDSDYVMNTNSNLGVLYGVIGWKTLTDGRKSFQRP